MEITLPQMLTFIGFSIFLIGMILIYIGNHSIEKRKVLADEIQVSRAIGQSTPQYIFTIENPSRLEGEIPGYGTGEFNLYVIPHYGDPNLGDVDLWYRQSLDVYCHLKGPSQTALESQSFGCNLSEGRYCILFVPTGNVEIKTTLSLTQIYREKPYENWFGLGQTLWEVGIPIMITGLVGLLFA